MVSLRSQVTKKILNYFFLNPQESLYVNELCRKLQLDKRNLVKKLNELQRQGILKQEARGNLKLYSINKAYPLYKEYRKIVMKTIGPEKQLREILKETSGVKKAYLYGSYVNNKMEPYSDIDLLVAGNHSIADLQHKLNKLQKGLEREISVVNITEKELDKRLKGKDPFFSGIFRGKYISLV